MAYEPFLIADFKTGKYLRREPWLLPEDAFEILRNGHIKNGVLEKRRGYEVFGRFAHTDTEQDTTPNSVKTSFSGTTTYNPLRAGDFDVQDVTLNDDSTESFTDNGDGTLTGDQGATGTYTTTTGAWTLDFSGSLPPKNGTNIDIEYDHHPGNAVMGLWNYLTSGGSEVLLAFDKKRMGCWNTSTEKFEDKTATAGQDAGGASEVIDFSGDNTNYFWAQNWEMPAGTFRIYFCNNTATTIAEAGGDVDYGVLYWDGTNIKPLVVDTDGAAVNNHINGCLLMFIYHSRLILLRTNESGTSYYQRARWCGVNDPTDWDESNTGVGHVDADTEDWIIGADMLAGELIVFFERSVKKLVYTGDADDPFKWKNIDDTEGAYATMSILPFSDELMAVGPTRLISTDGRSVYGIDDKIPDFMLEWRQDGVPYCYSLVLEEMKQGLIAYPSLSASVDADGNYYPDSCLIFNYDDNSYSTYELPIHCLGYSSLQNDLTWDDSETTWDEADWTWDSRELQAGYPTSLMGCRDGYVYKINSGGSDDGSAIEFEALSGRWNPYSKEGYKAHLGCIEFLVDVGTELSFDVESYIDSQNSSFQTKTVTCTKVSQEDDKVWKKVSVNAIAASHRIKITNNATGNRPRIHAIVPWFKRAGRLI